MKKKISTPQGKTNNRQQKIDRKSFSDDPFVQKIEQTVKGFKPPTVKPTNTTDEGTRLNKYVSNAGICARRKADEHIAAGDVTVNDTVVLEMGYKVKPNDIVKFKGKKIIAEQKVYVLLNKPKGYITTTDDEMDRKTVMDLVKSASKNRLYPVGRLDRNTLGLLLLTNDGELAQKLTHPSSEITKVYQVELDRPLEKVDLEKVRNGVQLEDGFAKVDEIDYTLPRGDDKHIGVELHSGKNRIVRRIFEEIGYEVEKLDRVLFAGLTKKDLPRGKWRFLTEKEIIFLKHFISNTKKKPIATK